MAYPTGRPARGAWWSAWTSLAVTAGIVMALGSFFTPGPLHPAIRQSLNLHVVNPVGLGAFTPLHLLSTPLFVAPFAFAAASAVARWRRARGDEREQLKWLAGAAGLIPLTIYLALVVGHTQAVPVLIQDLFGMMAFLPLSIGIPTAITIAILKYHLYDIDVIFNRALVFGAMAGFITVVYIAIVAGIGALIGIGAKPNLGLSIIATAVVAVAFQPIREHVQRLGNRLVYGSRATPYEVMADFSYRMANSLAVDQVLPQMAEAAASGVRAKYALVRLFLPGADEQVLWWPAEPPSVHLDRSLSISYRGEPVGEIAIAKPVGEALSSAEDKLLSDLAAQAGLVMHNVQLSTELQSRLHEISAQARDLRASRGRIVMAEDAERRRLEASIEANVYGNLALVAAQLQAMEATLARDPAASPAGIGALSPSCGKALENLRDIARGIYPPLLRDHGLLAALQDKAAKSSTPVEVDADSIGRYPTEVEGAVYFSCLEALRTASRSVRIKLAAGDGTLRFEVNGSSCAADALQDIEDRVEALGGQLDVAALGDFRGTIPLASVAPVAIGWRGRDGNDPSIDIAKDADQRF
jgi:signal transduction histidine kinase